MAGIVNQMYVHATVLMEGDVYDRKPLMKCYLLDERVVL